GNRTLFLLPLGEFVRLLDMRKRIAELARSDCVGRSLERVSKLLRRCALRLGRRRRHHGCACRRHQSKRDSRNTCPHTTAERHRALHLACPAGARTTGWLELEQALAAMPRSGMLQKCIRRRIVAEDWILN